jgi:N4-(beta-N-acetylglucosaminyl)-L-asparaginase
MSSRKEFIVQSAMATGAGLLGLDAKAGQQMKNTGAGNSPFIIATWKNTDATEAGWKTMTQGGTALDAVEAGARVPEADPNNTSVGYGGLPDRDGFVTLDACIMDYLGTAGSVTYLQHIMHPVSVARKVMEKTPHVMLSGDGALQFALQQGFLKQNLLTEKSKRASGFWRLIKAVI